MKKTLGIVGGMGPLSTADFFYKVVQNTKADSDAERLVGRPALLPGR